MNANKCQQAMILDMEIHMVHMKCSFLLMDDERMHPGQIALLMTMKALGPSNQRTLAKKMNCSPASIGVSVKRLEKTGLLEKQADERDMRTTRVALTHQGMLLAKKSEAVVNGLMQRKYDGFSEEELTDMNGYLTRIKDNMENFHLELTRNKTRNDRHGERAE